MIQKYISDSQMFLPVTYILYVCMYMCIYIYVCMYVIHIYFLTTVRLENSNSI